ncbi:MAG TPA: NAD(P)-dependent oxidoreductase [Terriglobales bacterium]|nr:NAD(P)-dependent oxidoreductase [Terriglobales bacterium]
MTVDVLCLRPKIDFDRAGALPPISLNIAYRKPNDADIPEIMQQARGLVIPAVGPKLAPALFGNSAIKFVQVTGAGVDRLDELIVKRAGIAVANVPAGSNAAVAEYVITMASLLLRRFTWASEEIRKGNYSDFRSRMLADNLLGIENLLIGIVGLGTIGLAVAEAFHKMGCRICYYDPMLRDEKTAQALGAEPLSLDELLKSADVVTFHLPLLPETKGLIGAWELARMKPGAILVQASRGGIVDEASLAENLRSGHLGGAAVDVYSTEPPAPDNPLLTLHGEAARRLILTPHIAGVTRQSAAFLFRAAWQNVERVLIANEPPLNRVY